MYGLLSSWQGPFCEGLAVFHRNVGDSCPQVCGQLPLVGADRLRAGGGWLSLGVLGAGPPSGDWRADLASIAWATLATGRRHRWFAQLGIHPIPGPRTIRYGQAAMRSLDGLGLDEAAEVNILAVLNNYISGFLQREMAWQRLASRIGPATAEPGTPHAGQAAHSARAATPRHLAARTRLADDESFAFGLDRLLDGIAVLVAQVGQ